MGNVPFLRELFNPANYFFNPYAIPNIAGAVYCFFLGIFCFIKKKKKGISVSLLNISCGGYLFFFALMYSANNPYVAYLWNKIAYYLAVCFLSVNSYFVSLDITGEIKNKKKRVVLYFSYFTMILFAVLTAFTDLSVKFPPRKFFWGYFTNTGIIHHIFFPLWLILALIAIYNAYHAYKKEEDLLEKHKLRIFLYAFLIGTSGITDYLPAYGIGIYPFGYIGIISYITLFAYNFIKYKAFGIETVFHKTFLWVVSIFFIVFPVGIIAAFTSKLLSNTLPVFLIALIFSAILVTFSYYYFYLRPKIDHLFGKRQFAYFELLGRISEKVSTVIDIKEFAEKLLNELDACIMPQKIYLWLSDEEKQNYFLYAEKNPILAPQVYQEKKEILPMEDAITRYLRVSRKVLEPPLINLDPELKNLQSSSYFQFLKNENMEVLIPLTMEENLIGILGLGRKRSLRMYAKQDIGILDTLGKELGTSMYNALHHQDILEKERLEEEMLMGRQIQIALLPRKIPQIAGLDIQGVMLPAKEIGGDYYDFITLPGENRLAIVVGDVSGKGVPAGLIMATAKATLRGLIEQNLTSRQMLIKTNSILHEYTNGEKFMTMLFVQWDAQVRKLRYSSAGHEHLLIYRNNNGIVEFIKSGGFMLGILPDIANFLEEHELSLNAGDKIVLYTDGITEAHNIQEEMYGLERLMGAVKKHGYKSAAELIVSIKGDVYDFIGSREQYDDITLVVLEAT